MSSLEMHASTLLLASVWKASVSWPQSILTSTQRIVTLLNLFEAHLIISI